MSRGSRRSQEVARGGVNIHSNLWRQFVRNFLFDDWWRMAATAEARTRLYTMAVFTSVAKKRLNLKEKEYHLNILEQTVNKQPYEPWASIIWIISVCFQTKRGEILPSFPTLDLRPDLWQFDTVQGCRSTCSHILWFPPRSSRIFWYGKFIPIWSFFRLPLNNCCCLKHPGHAKMSSKMLLMTITATTSSRLIRDMLSSPSNSQLSKIYILTNIMQLRILRIVTIPKYTPKTVKNHIYAKLANKNDLKWSNMITYTPQNDQRIAQNKSGPGSCQISAGRHHQHGCPSGEESLHFLVNLIVSLFHMNWIELRLFDIFWSILILIWTDR